MSIAECDKNKTKKVVVNKTEDQNLMSVDNIDSSDSTDESMSETSSRGDDFEEKKIT